MGEECVAGETLVLSKSSTLASWREAQRAQSPPRDKTEVRCEVVHLGVAVIHRVQLWLF